jgi:hypothetical protein
VLTCALVENASTTVVPDQSRLEPSAMQLPPFEVIGGQRGPDLHSDRRRFIQYRYDLRLISEELFGKDAKIPPLQIAYYVESHVGRGETVRGRDHAYILPTESVRVLSLVPNDAGDIRDAASGTFSDIEAERFRARVWFVAAGVLFAAAALVILVMLVRLVGRARAEGAAGRPLLSDGTILRAVGRELAAVQRQSEREGWTRELVSRALAAFRIAATIALARPVGQHVSSAAANPGSPGDHEGQLPIRGGRLWGRTVLVSGSATGDAVARELARNASGSLRHRQGLEQLQAVLARFTAAAFGRDDRLDAAALSESLNLGVGELGRLKLDALWVTKRLKGITQFAADLGSRAWSR